tara:strand:+ start:18938 stop:20173 length:1236 start_codon:yes stop_codon:yes gene_type:complete
MARTVNRNQTLEEFRTKYNELAADVGSINGLAGGISNNNNLVDAINEIENKTFYFQTFEYSASASQTAFTGADGNGNTLKIRAGRFQVFHNKSGSAEHLVQGDDYSISNLVNGEYGTVTLNTAASAGDVITIYAFTGSAVGTAGTGGGGAAGQFSETAANAIYNINSSGVILNGDGGSKTLELESGYTLQLAGKTFAEDDIVATAAGKKVQFPIVSDGTAQFTGGVGTGFSSITSTTFVGALTGNATTSSTTAAISGHAASGLSDINYTTTPSNGQILQWDNANGYWEPADKDNSDNVAEGSTNLYFTNERAQDALGPSFTHSNHTNVTATYDDSSGEIRLVAAATYADSDVQSYLSGGDGLAMSGSGVFSVNTSNGIEINSDNVELDYEIVSTAPSSASGTSAGHLWFVV